MSILARYITREMMKYLALVLLGAVGIYMVVDFFENFDDFIEAGLSAGRILYYFQLKLPLVLVQVAPVGLLLAALVTLGLMNRNNEILSLLAGGLSARCALRPVVAVGMVFGLTLFFFAETVVPAFIAGANQIWRNEVKKKGSESTTSANNIWIRDRQAIYHIAYYNPHQKTISGVSLNYFDDGFRLLRRVDAERGDFRQGQWVLQEVMEQVRNPQTHEYAVTLSSEKALSLGFQPEDLKRVVKRSEEMNFSELLDYIGEVESEGYDATPYRVDFYAKFAQPVGLVLLLLVAASVAVQRRVRDSLVLLIASGGGVFFCYWVLHSFCVSVGYGGILPPFLAAWSANLVFAAAGIFGAARVVQG
jgi:lipopolysaccharide export system permease protein